MWIDVPRGTCPTSDQMAIALSELQWRTGTTVERRAGHWIPVGSRDWRRLIGCRYAAVLRESVDLGYVEINHRYSSGRFPKSYRLARRYRSPRTEQWPATDKPRSRIRLREDDAVGYWLVSRFPLARLPHPGHLAGWDSYCTRQIRCGGYYAIRCQYGRFHTNFTGLRKRIRRELVTPQGTTFFEIDVSNCQPLIVGLLARQQQQTNNRTNQQTTNQKTTNQQVTTTKHHNTICGASGVVDYLSYCERGVLYDELLRECTGVMLWDWLPVHQRHRYGENRPLNRRDVKRQFIVLLFADIPTTRRMPLFDVVGNRWPGVADFILQSKEVCYQELARRCQQMESSIMIDGACGRLMRDCPHIPLITIHDALATTIKHAALVREVLRAEFESYGVQVSVKQCQ